MGSKKLIYTIVLCHFASALPALGMPPYFAQILAKSFPLQNQSILPWIGLFYVLPTLAAALSSPLWGSLGDRFGKKPLLIRAQIGLAFSYFLTSFARCPREFFYALIIQGVLGGTFSASRSYLTENLAKDQIANGLTLMEASPRAALILGPCLIGILASHHAPLLIYRALAILPLAATCAILLLPEENNHSSERASSAPVQEQSRMKGPVTAQMSIELLILFQFLFSLSLVIVAPYFNYVLNNSFPYLTSTEGGILFGLPHLIYLVAAKPLSRALDLYKADSILLLGFTSLVASLVFQITPNFSLFVFFRIVTGLSMTLCFIGFHLMLAQILPHKKCGKIFGWLESTLRVSQALGGLIASIGFKAMGPQSLFYASALIIAVPALILAFSILNTPKESDLCNLQTQ